MAQRRAPDGSGPSLLQRAVARLARREYSRQELGARLRPYLRPEDDPAELEHVLDRLQREGKLSDQRFAEAFVRSRSARFGSRRIGRELAAHGVARDLSRATTQALAGTDAERLRALWARRFGVAPADPRQWARQARFLVQRGFAPAEVTRLLRNLGAAAAAPPHEPSDEPDSGESGEPGC